MLLIFFDFALSSCKWLRWDRCWLDDWDPCRKGYGSTQVRPNCLYSYLRIYQKTPCRRCCYCEAAQLDREETEVEFILGGHTVLCIPVWWRWIACWGSCGESEFNSSLDPCQSLHTGLSREDFVPPFLHATKYLFLFRAYQRASLSEAPQTICCETNEIPIFPWWCRLPRSHPILSLFFFGSYD